MKALIRPKLRSSPRVSGAPSASIAQHWSALLVIHPPRPRRSSAPLRGRSPPASIEAISSGASSWSSASGAIRRRGPGDQRPRRLALERAVADRPQLAHRGEPRVAVLADERQPQLPGIGLRQVRRDRSHRRSPNKDRSAPATKRRPGRPRSAPTPAAAAATAAAPAPATRAPAATPIGAAGRAAPSRSPWPGRSASW